jgi:hypothetical protein
LSNSPSPTTGKFNITDKQEVFLDGKKCDAWSSSKHAESARMIEDRFGLPVFQVGPDDRALWWLVRVLLKDKSTVYRLQGYEDHVFAISLRPGIGPSRNIRCIKCRQRSDTG